MESPARSLIAVLAVIALVAVAFALRVNAENSAEATEPSGPAPGAHYATAGCGSGVLKPPAELTADEARDLTLCLINFERGKVGVRPLGTDPLLQDAADRHSADMVARGFFEHDTPEGVTPQERIARALYKPIGGWTGENIAWGEGTEGSIAALTDRLMHSPGHRENILRPGFTEVGVGIVFGGINQKPGHAKALTMTTNFGG